MHTTTSFSSRVAAQFPSLGRPATLDTIGPCVSMTAIKVPAWFTIGAALRVAQCKDVEHLLVVDRGAVVGTAAVRAMQGAPAGDPVARWMSRVSVTLPVETPRIEASRLMTSLDVECLPVASGPLLVGLITRDDLALDGRQSAG
jgi:predicted transcriptional regulator